MIPKLVSVGLPAVIVLGFAVLATRVLPDLAHALTAFVLTPGGLVAAALLWLWLRKRR